MFSILADPRSQQGYQWNTLKVPSTSFFFFFFFFENCSNDLMKTLPIKVKLSVLMLNEGLQNHLTSMFTCDKSTAQEYTFKNEQLIKTIDKFYHTNLLL
jgi:hypothetical protein